MSGTRAKLVITACAAAHVLLLAGGLAASAQTTQDARQDGKAFGAAIGTRAQQSARQTPTSESVPNYGSGPPPQSVYFDDPDRMAPAAGAAAQTHDGYQAVKQSVRSRARFEPADIEATIARGQAVAEDPLSYTSNIVSGSSGSCRELPPSSGSGATYEATCNSGYALEQRQESCSIALAVSFEERFAYRYYAENPLHTGLSPHMGEFAAAIASGTCQVEGPTDPCQVPRAYGLRPSSRCGQYATNIVRCSSELGGLGGNLVPATGQTWFQRIVERTPRTSRDESGCSGLASDPACAAQGEACTSSDPVTRIIDGVAVTQPCWAWSRSYQCNRITPAQDCTDLEANTACSFLRQDCLTEDSPCTTWERIYRCPIPDQPAATKQYICDGDIYCINGECETIDRQPNTEFRDAAVALNAAKQAGQELDSDSLSLFKGTRETCHKKVFGLLNCCAGKAFPLIPGASLLVSLGCDREEVLLHQRDAQGLCAYVGSYCSDSVLGVCVTKKKTYCCFESKLSRILQEQGRPQIGKPWDSARREQCLGFTVDEFSRLDLSRMDFSEVYAEFQDAARLPEELGTVTDMQRKISDFYAINGPGK